LPTPDLDEWLARQEIPIEDTITIEDYQYRIAEMLGFEPTSKQWAVVAKVWDEKYNVLAPRGIYSTTYTYETGPRAGQRETRWVISGRPGLWSYEAMLRMLEEMEEE